MLSRLVFITITLLLAVSIVTSENEIENKSDDDTTSQLRSDSSHKASLDRRNQKTAVTTLVTHKNNVGTSKFTAKPSEREKIKTVGIKATKKSQRKSTVTVKIQTKSGRKTTTPPKKKFIKSSAKPKTTVSTKVKAKNQANLKNQIGTVKPKSKGKGKPKTLTNGNLNKPIQRISASKLQQQLKQQKVKKVKERFNVTPKKLKNGKSTVKPAKKSKFATDATKKRKNLVHT